MLIRNGILLPLEEGDAPVRGDLRVGDGQIEAVDQSLALIEGEEVVDAAGCFILPGLISVGADLQDTLLLDAEQAATSRMSSQVCDTKRLRELLRSEALIHSVAAGAERLLRQGVTTILSVNEPSLSDRVFSTALDAGVRLIGAPCLRASLGDAATQLQGITEQIHRWHGSNEGRSQVAVAVDTPLQCSNELLQQGASLAFENDLLLHCNLMLSKEMVDEINVRAGCHAVEFLMEMGCLSSQTLLSGCHHLGAEEPNFLFGTGTHVVDIGASPDGLCDDGSSRAALVDNGVSVALGTPVGGGQVIDLARRGRAIGWTPQATLQQCIEGGARAIGMDDRLGFLQAGFAADLIIVEGAHGPADPHDVVLKASQEHTIRDVMVAGDFSVRNGALQCSQVSSRAEDIVESVVDALQAESGNS